MGKITRYIEGLKSFFLDLGEQKGFLPIEKSFKYKKINNGDLIPVQIKREAHGTKMALLSQNLSLRYKSLIIMENYHGKNNILITNKIDKFLIDRKLLKLKASIKNTHKLIIRSSALNKSSEEIIFEYRVLSLLWWKLNDIITNKADKVGPIAINNSLEEFLEQEIGRNDKVKTNSMLTDRYTHLLQDLNIERQIVLDNQISKRIQSICHKKIAINKYGYIIIGRTDMGWTVDVNSGSPDTESKSHYQINYDACAMIFEQIFLRNMNGLIVIDFINLFSPWETILLEERVRELSMLDYLSINFEGIDKNYVAIIVRQNLGHQLSKKELMTISALAELEYKSVNVKTKGAMKLIMSRFTANLILENAFIKNLISISNIRRLPISFQIENDDYKEDFEFRRI